MVGLVTAFKRAGPTWTPGSCGVVERFQKKSSKKGGTGWLTLRSKRIPLLPVLSSVGCWFRAATFRRGEAGKEGFWGPVSRAAGKVNKTVSKCQKRQQFVHARDRWDGACRLAGRLGGRW